MANEEIFVIVQTEHKTAMENINEILSVEGIHLAFVGRIDLSAFSRRSDDGILTQSVNQLYDMFQAAY